MFMFICRSVLFGIINVSDKGFRENHNPHFMFNNPPPKIVLFCDLMSESNVEPFTPKITIWRMRIA